MKYHCKNCKYEGNVAPKNFQQFPAAAKAHHKEHSPACLTPDLRMRKMMLIVYEVTGTTTLYLTDNPAFLEADEKYIGFCSKKYEALIESVPRMCTAIEGTLVDMHITHVICTGVIFGRSLGHT